MSICKTSIIHEDCTMGENVTIGSFCVIGNCTIGDNCIIHSHVTIGDDVYIEEDVEIFEGAVIGKHPQGAGATSRPIEYDKCIRIGTRSNIGPHTIIYYDVHIGHNTLIGDGASIREQSRIGDYCIISRYVTINYNVQVGNHVKIMDSSHITGNTLIEDDVFISALVGTANDNSFSRHYNQGVSGPWFKEKAFVGLGANILPSVVINEKSIIGAGALVTKNVEEETFVKGIPARVE